MLLVLSSESSLYNRDKLGINDVDGWLGGSVQCGYPSIIS